MKKIILGIAVLIGFNVNAQTPEQEMFIKLYKENYIEWISSPEISLLQARDPELKAIIDQIPLNETLAYQNAISKAQTERVDGKSLSITDILGDGAKDISMDIIKELVSKENTDVIINLYWDVIRSAETKEIVDLILPHVQSAREHFEKAGVEIARTASN